MGYCLFTYLGEVKNYNPNEYYLNGKSLNKNNKDKFYLKYLYSKFNISRIYLFTTEEIIKQNGGENIREFFEHWGINKDEINKFIGRKILQNLGNLKEIFFKKVNINLKIKVKKEKLKENDLIEFVNLIKELNNEKLNILLDITHSYRDIPLFYLSLINLIKSAEDVGIDIDFLYVRETTKGKANIEILNDVKEFQNWSYAISLIKKSFNLMFLAELIGKYSTNIANNLKNLHFYFSLNLLSHLYDEIIKLEENLTNRKDRLPLSFKLIEEDLDNFIKKFSKNNFVDFQKELWEFSFENKLYDKGLLALREYIISELMSLYYQKNEDIQNPYKRQLIETILNCEKYMVENISKEFYEFWRNIGKIRNLIAHLKGIEEEENLVKSFIENFSFENIEQDIQSLKNKIKEKIPSKKDLKAFQKELKENWNKKCKAGDKK